MLQNPVISMLRACLIWTLFISTTSAQSLNSMSERKALEEKEFELFARDFIADFKLQDVQSVVTKHFVSAQESERLASTLQRNTLRLPAKKGYDSLRHFYATTLGMKIGDLLQHEMNFQTLEIDSVKSQTVLAEKLFKPGHVDNVGVLTIFCSDGNHSYRFELLPLFREGSEWKLFSTEFRWRQDFERRGDE